MWLLTVELQNEFNQLGHDVSTLPSLCTMNLSSRYLGARSLRESINAAGQNYDDGHHALADAKMAAYLLGRFIREGARFPEEQQAAIEYQLPSLSGPTRNLMPRPVKNEIVNSNKVTLRGLTVVISGDLVNFTREGAKAAVVNAGGRTSDLVTTRADYLVCGHGTGESKLGHARAMLVPTITEAAFIDFLAGGEQQLDAAGHLLDYHPPVTSNGSQYRQNPRAKQG